MQFPQRRVLSQIGACLVFAFVTFGAAPLAWSAEVCRLECLVGLDDACARGLKAVGSGWTSDVRKARVYVEKNAHGFFYYSNFRTPGHDHQTKIASDNPAIADASFAFLNIVYTERPSGAV